MRPRIRPTKMTRRRVLAERPGVTVSRTVAALRRSREALAGLEDQLDDLLGRLHAPSRGLDRAAGERLAAAKNDLVAAMANLRGVELFG